LRRASLRAAETSSNRSRPLRALGDVAASVAPALHDVLSETPAGASRGRRRLGGPPNYRLSPVARPRYLMAMQGRLPIPSVRALPPDLGPVLEFMRALWALDHALATRHRQIAVRFGVTGSQRLVVRIVGQKPGVSAGQVADVLHVHPSTLTPTLQALAQRGLLRRAPDPRDRRRSVLSLTRRGQRVDAAAAQLVDKAVRTALAQLLASEVFSARRVLHAVAASVGGEVSPHDALEATARQARQRGRAGARARKIPLPRAEVQVAATREARDPVAARDTQDRAACAGERPAPGSAAEVS
jgi:DNA-binding MarR family transcriptional regulator